MGIEMGRAANGRDGVGSGYDAEVISDGSRTLVALYHVAQHAWVAIGEFEVDADVDPDAVARDLACDPGSWGEALVWRKRDPETYERLAQSFEALEDQWKAEQAGT